MCDFCSNIKNRNKEIIWLVRSTYADDNVCEYVNNKNCENCKGCNMHFKLSGYEYDGNTYVGVEYCQVITPNNSEDVIIRPFSESVQFNYCPFCGKQISKNILPFNDIKQYSIEIRDDED